MKRPLYLLSLLVFALQQHTSFYQFLSVLQFERKSFETILINPAINGSKPLDRWWPQFIIKNSIFRFFFLPKKSEEYYVIVARNSHTERIEFNK